jgi:putative membrane protein
MMTDEDSTPTARSMIPDGDPRVQLATERTVLAWIRTGLALMAFGFVVARFALILQTLGINTNIMYSLSATLIGIFMVLLGAIANAGASLHYRKYFRGVVQSGQQPFTASSLAIWVAIASALIGVLLIVYLLLVGVASWKAGFRPSSGSSNVQIFSTSQSDFSHARNTSSFQRR